MNDRSNKTVHMTYMFSPFATKYNVLVIIFLHIVKTLK